MSGASWNIPPETLENLFEDFKPALNDAEANLEANRCINCYEAPCVSACPTRIDIPKFIRRIASGNLSGAARTILDSNILGLSCAQVCPTEVLCEGSCVYNSLNKKPIMIGKLQRHAVEHAYDQELEFYKPGKPSGKRVALVGAGPASLSCAHELRILGHETVIFEKSELPGGLNTVGIAPYKMKALTSLREVERIGKLGVEFRFGKELGRDFSLEDLTREFDAVFLGLGLGPDSRLEASKNFEHPRVRGAVEFISQLKSDNASRLDWLREVKTALVVGGGNTALDACRELKKLGVPRVILSYRRDEAAMSGYVHELKWAKQEGVEFWFETLPTCFEKVPGDHIKVRFQKTDLDVGLVLVAIGQAKIKLAQTSHPKVFTGGDFASGGKEVVNAVAEGKLAAKRMDEGFKEEGFKNG